MAIDKPTPGLASETTLVSQHPTEQEPRTTGVRTRLSGAPFAQRYQRKGHLDGGGMGNIESAFDPVLGRSVAVKVLQTLSDGDPELLRKFIAEAQITGQLDHPNIVPVYDLGQHEDNPFIVMKLVRGRTFAALLAERPGPRSTDDLQQFLGTVLHVCDALSFAHSRGVIHCDVKPENVMVGDHGQVYLMDWGVASLAGRSSAPGTTEQQTDAEAFSAPVQLSATANEGSASTDDIKGTPAYMAPEQFSGRDDLLDERTDVYGLGGLLYEILTGSAPNGRQRVVGPSLSAEPRALPRENELWAQLPPELNRITSQALAPNPARRQQSVLELKSDLERFLSGDRWFEAKLFRAGEYIISEGDAGDAAYIIERGECEVRRRVGAGSVALRRLGPGAVFGETAVFARSPRTASVVALGDVTVKLITADSLNRELDRSPWLGAFVRSLAGLFREADQRLAEPHEPQQDPALERQLELAAAVVEQIDALADLDAGSEEMPSLLRALGEATLAFVLALDGNLKRLSVIDQEFEFELINSVVDVPRRLSEGQLTELAVRVAEALKFCAPDHMLGEIAIAYAQAGDRQRALELVLTNLETAANAYVAECKAGDVYHALGENDAAEAYYRRAFAIATPTQRSEARLRLTSHLIDTGREQEAAAFIAQERAAASAPARPPSVGRNEPCPCGSGKKYKKCHGA